MSRRALLNAEHIDPRSRRATPHWVLLLSAKKQNTEATIHTSSPKLDQGRLEQQRLVWWVSISAATFRIWHKLQERINQSCIYQRLRAWALFKQTAWVLLLLMSIPIWPQCIHDQMAASSRITSHVTKLESFQTGFFRMTMTQMSSTVNICQSIKEHLWDVVESNLGQLCDAGTNELCLIMCGNVIMSHLNKKDRYERQESSDKNPRFWISVLHKPYNYRTTGGLLRAKP